MRAILELLRVFIILALIGGLGWGVVRHIYTSNKVPTDYMWLGLISVFLFVFVLYRNKLQFSGWYKGKERLPRSVSFILISVSFILFIAPFILYSYLH
ncbi:hypothetical protein [Sporosarcina sp. A2]|uniref:hypothetical protein n=1 Tax=Sporosarcina sp. A2 TaxID=3393449 RepID=UPI003D792A67